MGLFLQLRFIYGRIFFALQIIKRARQNYLLDQYKEKQPQAAQILQDVLSARGVRGQWNKFSGFVRTDLFLSRAYELFKRTFTNVFVCFLSGTNRIYEGSSPVVAVS